MTAKASTKTTNVTSMVSTEESPEFKRRRMKEVRTLVARAHKQGKRVDQMGFEGSDIARSQIALQDLLAKSEERHQKATKHVSAMTEMSDFFAMVMSHAAKDMIQRSEDMAELSDTLYKERMSHMQTAEHLQEMFSAKCEADQNLEALKRSFEILNG